MQTIMDSIKIGLSKVKVLKREVNEQTRKETTKEVHSGVVIGRTTAFLKVFCPLAAPRNQGDAGPETAQYYPIASRNMWCELDGERATPLPIPANVV